MENTFRIALQQIATHLFHSGLVKEHHRQELQGVISGEVSQTFDSFSVDLVGADTTAYLTVENGLRWSRLTDNMFSTDEKGDEYMKSALRFRINYPTHGSCSVEEFQARLDFFNKVAGLLASLQAEFTGEFWLLVDTAEKIAERKAKADIARHEGEVLRFVRDNCKGFRVETSKTFPRPEGLKDGLHVCNVAGKSYKLNVNAGQCILTRTA